jgi:hypothetical protein
MPLVKPIERIPQISCRGGKGIYRKPDGATHNILCSPLKSGLSRIFRAAAARCWRSGGDRARQGVDELPELFLELCGEGGLPDRGGALVIAGAFLSSPAPIGLVRTPVVGRVPPAPPAVAAVPGRVGPCG